MSEPKNRHEENMLLRLIEIEEAKMRAQADDKLPEAGVDAVTRRLLNAKEAILADFNRGPGLTLAKKRAGWKIAVPAGIAALLLLGFGLPLLLKRHALPQARLVMSAGEVKTQAAALPAPGAPIAPGTFLATKNKSLAVLEWGTEQGVAGVKVALSRDANLQTGAVSQGDGQPLLEIEHRQGLAFYAVQKGSMRLLIKTPAAVIGVRGTSFAVKATAQSTTVLMREGSVEVTPQQAEAAVRQVSAKEKIQIVSSGKEALVSKLTPAEERYLEVFEKLAGQNAGAAKNAAALGAELFSAEDQLQQPVALPLPAPDNNTPQKFGKLSRVSLKTGESYTGFYSQKGGKAQIVTPTGTVTVEVDQVADVQDMQ